MGSPVDHGLIKNKGIQHISTKVLSLSMINIRICIHLNLYTEKGKGSPRCVSSNANQWMPDSNGEGLISTVVRDGPLQVFAGLGSENAVAEEFGNRPRLFLSDRFGKGEGRGPGLTTPKVLEEAIARCLDRVWQTLGRLKGSARRKPRISNFRQRLNSPS